MTTKDITIKAIIELYNTGQQNKALKLAQLNNLTISDVWAGWARIQAAKKEDKKTLIANAVEAKKAGKQAKLVEAQAAAAPMDIKPLLVIGGVLIALYSVYNIFKKKRKK
jgi:hypothetical protein